MMSPKITQINQENVQTLQTNSQLTSRPFAPIAKQTTSTLTSHNYQEKTGRLLQRKTNLLAIPGLMEEPKTRGSQTIQAKLIIGEPGDKYEQEADAVATQIVQQIHQPDSDKLQLESLREDDQLQMKSMVQQRPEIHENQEVSQTQSKVIQRTTDAEVREHLSQEDIDYYEEWLQSKGAKSQESLDVLIAPLTIEELKNKLEDHEARELNEDDPADKWEYFLPDITPFANQLDNLFASSQEFGQYIQQRQTEGVNSAGNVNVLGESDFLEALVNEVKLQYQNSGRVFELSQQVHTRLGELSSADENSFHSYLKVNIAKFIEAEDVEAFTSKFGGTNKAIYLRKSTFDNITELYVHELMHRYSSGNVSQLGQSINEGLTELFMRKLLTSLGYSIANTFYTKEVELVQKLIEVFFNNDLEIFKEAYFKGNIQPVINKILMELQPEEYDILIKGRDVQEKIKILQEKPEQKEQEAEEETEIPATSDPTSSKGKQKRKAKNSSQDQSPPRKSKRLAKEKPEFQKGLS